MGVSLVRVCEICGKEYTKVVGVSFVKYCSEGCRKEAARRRYTPVGKAVKRCPTCGNEFAAINKNQVYCCGKCRPSIKDIRRNRKRPKNHRYVCKHCGKEFFGGVTREKHKHLFCSRKCSQVHALVASANREAARELKKIVKRRCGGCGAVFVAVNNREKYCSHECQLVANRKRVRERANKLRPLLFKGRTVNCRHCGKPFKTTFKGSKCFCSDECRDASIKLQRKNGKHRLKGKIVDKDITLKKVATRHKNICALCGEMVEWSDFSIRDGFFIAGERYPSIDHIIPLSVGGVHAWDNVQLAHMGCNSAKGNNFLVCEVVMGEGGDRLTPWGY